MNGTSDIYKITVIDGQQQEFRCRDQMNAISRFEEYISQNDISEPYIECVDNKHCIIGFSYKPDLFITLEPIPEGYENKIDHIIEKINYKVECDSVS